MGQLNNKEFSSKQERMVADVLGCTVVSGSGSRPFNPGDVKSDKWLCECKTHTEPGHDIFFSYEVYEKIIGESLFAHRSPLLVTDDGSQTLEKTWCIFPPASVNSDLVCKIKYPELKTKNITFKHVGKIEEYTALQKFNNNENVVYDIHWGRYFVLMCPLTTLVKILEEDI